ncbi:hypothetical protein AT520_003965 [Escherichia coli]|nr:hypothetical protein [Escherichia coli]EJA4827491.1 hypothetical protein [Escherichia coli]EJI1860927.1 hypothetical protein [Escherichia coli]EJK2348734.1 hypothetical protein [Escherichia coli]HBA9622968.1 hypothetical protein [Escherichia coli]
MLRRGLTNIEILNMPICDFYELWFFESFIEPQGPVVNDLHQAHLAYATFANNPNLTKEGSKKLKMKDFMFIKEKVFKSPEELEEEQKKAAEANRKKIESLFEPELLAKMKSKAKKKGAN